MKNLDYKEFYRRNLPHIQPRGATFLVNFRLAGSLPAGVMERLRADAEEVERKLLTINDSQKKTTTSRQGTTQVVCQVG